MTAKLSCRRLSTARAWNRFVIHLRSVPRELRGRKHRPGGNGERLRLFFIVPVLFLVIRAHCHIHRLHVELVKPQATAPYLKLVY